MIKVNIIFCLWLILICACSSIKQRIEIISLEKSSKHNGDSVFYESCKYWVLNKGSIIEILSFSDTITSNIKDYMFNTLPCEYRGKFKISENQYNFKVNAGGYSVIYNLDTTFYLGYFGKNKGLFIDSAYQEK